MHENRSQGTIGSWGLSSGEGLGSNPHPPFCLEGIKIPNAVFEVFCILFIFKFAPLHPRGQFLLCPQGRYCCFEYSSWVGEAKGLVLLFSASPFPPIPLGLFFIFLYCSSLPHRCLLCQFLDSFPSSSDRSLSRLALHFVVKLTWVVIYSFFP